MKKIVPLLAILILASCASVEKYNQQIATLHSVENLHKDVDKAYHKLQKLHPRLYTYTPKKVLDAKFDSLKLSISKPMNSHDFYKKLTVTVTNVRQGHAGVIPPNKKFAKKESKLNKKNKFEFYDLSFEHLDNALWVKSTLGKDSTFIGSEVLKVDDESVASLMETYKTRFSSDGYNTTFYNRRVGLVFPRLYYGDKGFKDSLSVTFRKKDSVFTKIFRRISKDSLAKKIKKDSIQLKNPKKLTKAEKKLAKERRKQKAKDNYKYGYIKAKKYYNRNFEFIGKDSAVAFMKIRSFTYGDFESFYKEVFTKIDSAKTKTLVIDLRNNSGGRLKEINELYSYLVDKEFKFVEEGETKARFPTLNSFLSRSNSSLGGIISKTIFTPIIFIKDLFKVHKKEGKRYYKFKSSKLQKPKELNFKGAVYVLINGYSFSASSVLSTNLQATKRAIFVGEETGGAYNSTVAGQTKYVTLPNSKVKLYFGLMALETPFKADIEGFGVKPDVEIVPTQNDRLNGIDPELNWVLNQVESSTK